MPRKIFLRLNRELLWKLDITRKLLGKLLWKLVEFHIKYFFTEFHTNS